MNFYKHPLCTETIGAPSDMQEDCSALPVAYQRDEHGIWSVSFWKPDPLEVARLFQGDVIALHVRAAGRQHPVVAMSTFPSYGNKAAGQPEQAAAPRPITEEDRLNVRINELSDENAELKKTIAWYQAQAAKLHGAAAKAALPADGLGSARIMQIHNALFPTHFKRAVDDNAIKFAKEIEREIAASSAGTPPPLDRAEFARKVVQSVAEIADRDSPADQPEMMLVTGPELAGIIASAFEDADEAAARPDGAPQ